MWTDEANIAHIELIISAVCVVYLLLLWVDRLTIFFFFPKVLIHIEYDALLPVGNWL